MSREAADAEDVEVGGANGTGTAAAGWAAVPEYGSRYSRRDYTQPQLFALLVLRQSLRTDYRGIVALVAERSELRCALGLAKVPHYSTLAHASRSILADAGAGQGALGRAHAAVVRHARKRGLSGRAPVAAVDATGLETRHVSAYLGMRWAGVNAGRKVGHRWALPRFRCSGSPPGRRAGTWHGTWWSPFMSAV